MPRFPATGTPFEGGNWALSFIDVSGRIAKVSLGNPLVSSAGGTKLVAWRNAIADASNAALMATNYTSEISYLSKQVFPFDEGHSSVATKAVMTFQNSKREVKLVAIPAPDLSLFNGDRKTLNATNPLVSAIITATLDILNGDGTEDDYVYIRGGLSDRTRANAIANEAPTPAEPLVTQNPPDAPAT